MIRRTILILIVFFMAVTSFAATPPTTSTRPLMLLDSARIAAMQAKQAASETSWTYALSRANTFLTSAYYYPEAAALCALIYRVTGTTSYRDRAKELLYDYAVNMDEDTYWEHVRSGSYGVTPITTDINDTVTTIPITNATGFSDRYGTGIHVAIDDEIMVCSSVSGTGLTGCVRGSLGTTAASHINGTNAECVIRTFGERNTFRGNCQWLMFAYDWLYEDLSASERTELGNKFLLWARYWDSWVDASNNFESIYDAGRDSDENTSIAQALTMIGINLYGDDVHSDTILDWGDGLLNYIVTNYQNNFFEGGLWGEGPNYSAHTVEYWLMTFLINSETRGIPYPNADYVRDSFHAWMHTFLPGFSGQFLWSDVENDAAGKFTSDYVLLHPHGMFDLVSLYEGALSSSDDQAIARNWINESISVEGEPDAGDTYSGMFRLIFNSPSGTATAPTNTTIPLNFKADGQGFIASRTSWASTADVVYGVAPRYDNYDHYKYIFNYVVASDGVFITKAADGYGPGLESSYPGAANMVSVDNRNRGGFLGVYSGGPGVINRHAHTTDYTLAEWDFVGLYAFIGYSAETPVLYNTRKLLHVKDEALLFVWDYILMDTTNTCTWLGTYVSSANTGSGQDCSRDKILSHHFQSPPSLSLGAYSATSEGKTQWFTPLLPDGYVGTIINEAATEPWASATENAMPSHQKKYHVEIAPSSDSDTEMFLSVLHWDDSTESNVATQQIPATGGVVAQAGNVIAVFSSNENTIASVTYTSDATNHYIVDLPVLTDITVTRAGITIVDNQSSGTDGILVFASDSGASEYIITAGESIITCYLDADGDLYSEGTSETGVEICSPNYYEAVDLTATSGDCDDSDAAINPGAEEICEDGIDNNCSGQNDEGCSTCSVNITSSSTSSQADYTLTANITAGTGTISGVTVNGTSVDCADGTCDEAEEELLYPVSLVVGNNPFNVAIVDGGAGCNGSTSVNYSQSTNRITVSNVNIQGVIFHE